MARNGNESVLGYALAIMAKDNAIEGNRHRCKCLLELKNGLFVTPHNFDTTKSRKVRALTMGGILQFFTLGTWNGVRGLVVTTSVVVKGDVVECVEDLGSLVAASDMSSSVSIGDILHWYCLRKESTYRRLRRRQPLEVLQSIFLEMTKRKFKKRGWRLKKVVILFWQIWCYGWGTCAYKLYFWIHTIMTKFYIQPGFTDFSRVYIFLGWPGVDFLEQLLEIPLCHLIRRKQRHWRPDITDFRVVHNRFLPLPKSPNSVKFALRRFSAGPWSFLKKRTVGLGPCFGRSNQRESHWFHSLASWSHQRKSPQVWYFFPQAGNSGAHPGMSAVLWKDSGKIHVCSLLCNVHGNHLTMFTIIIFKPIRSTAV